MFRVAYRILNNQMDAEDAVANVLCRLWTKRDKIKNLDEIDKILYTSVKNESIDLIRKKKRENLLIKEMMNNSISDSERTYLHKSKFEQINEIIFDLPETQKLILHLRMSEGYSLSKIADMVDMKVNTVEVNLSRARKKIRTEYEKRKSKY